MTQKMRMGENKAIREMLRRVLQSDFVDSGDEATVADSVDYVSLLSIPTSFCPLAFKGQPCYQLQLIDCGQVDDVTGYSPEHNSGQSIK